ncbi:hypothetical protein [Phenylobacterium sp.]|uniref:hypothetical protein n=1 Tax=Phenylobacterium sp. TaxID=1871053 RepID=UPI0025FB9AD8|nr:hypothetical protein [Phenylobacterium sp.]
MNTNFPNIAVTAPLVALLLASQSLAAPGTPTVAGSAGQASATSETLSISTTTAINPGDLVVLAVVSASNQTPIAADCLLSSSAGCGLSWDGKERNLALAGTGAPAWMATLNQSFGAMDNSPIRARTWFGYATSNIPSGSTFRVNFGGAIGAKAATIIVIPGAETSAALSFGGTSGASGAITFGTTPVLAPSQLVLATSFISGGGTDSYTEDVGFTFLHQTSAGAWPAIRVAYKLTSFAGTVGYTLTDSTSRTWISSYQVAK